MKEENLSLSYQEVLKTIETVNEIFRTKCTDKGFLKGSYHTAYTFFTTGACWYYSLLLKRLMPEGEIYLGDEDVAHVIFKYGDIFYDVYGFYTEYGAEHFYPDEEMVGRPWYDHVSNDEVHKLINFIEQEYKKLEYTPEQGRSI